MYPPVLVNFWIRLFPRSATYTLPAASVAICEGRSNWPLPVPGEPHSVTKLWARANRGPARMRRARLADSKRREGRMVRPFGEGAAAIHGPGPDAGGANGATRYGTKVLQVDSSVDQDHLPDGPESVVIRLHAQEIGACANPRAARIAAVPLHAVDPSLEWLVGKAHHLPSRQVEDAHAHTRGPRQTELDPGDTSADRVRQDPREVCLRYRPIIDRDRARLAHADGGLAFEDALVHVIADML